MTPKEHAEIWRKAAKVVRAMDTRARYYPSYVSGGGGGLRLISDAERPAEAAEPEDTPSTGGDIVRAMVPPGFALVPQEATEEMVMAGIEAARNWKPPRLEGKPDDRLSFGVGEGYQEAIWRAMVSAAMPSATSK